MPFTCSLMKSNASSTNACRFEGTPVVARRVTSHMKPNARTPSTSVVANVSTFSVQKPPPVPTGRVMNVRWCWMYSVGDS